MLRQIGYSTWILHGALLNPKIFIVCGNTQTKQFLKSKFHDLIVNMFLTERTTDPIYNGWPKFITMDQVENSVRGQDQHIPVIFDNSCFYV